MKHRYASMLAFGGLVVSLLIVPTAAIAGQEVIHVYGPGGPAPAMRAVSASYERDHAVTIDLVAGPTPAWRTEAVADAGLIFSGSENMMTDFVTGVPGIDTSTILPLYLRPAVILVHPGNPKHITGLDSLLQPGVRVLVVQGAGQTGMWEDIAGRLGDMRTIRALRSNIVSFAANSAVALKEWTSPNPPDAWIIYNIWQIAHPSVAQIVPIASPYEIYRDMDIALTERGKADSATLAFYHYLSSPQAAAIFARYGWSGM